MERKAPKKSVSSSLQDLRGKAKADKKYRFRNLYTLINEELLYQSFYRLKRTAAPGIDRVTWQDYEADLEVNISDLLDRLKAKRYRARLIRRKSIPKGNGKRRPLGIPVLEDKIVQQAVRTILEAIYEADFMESSHGYRPNRGAQALLKQLQHELYCEKRINWIVEADIKSFFDRMNHGWLIRMLEERINDRAMIRLITKWLKAGVLEEDGQEVHPETGSPQGGIISPLLANLYLHYVLDLWTEKPIRRSNRGQMLYVRYADDFICGFQYPSDARRYHQALKDRLAKFGLEIAEEKTHILRFSKFDPERSRPFTFLGIDFYWEADRNGKPMIKRRTNKEKFRRSLRGLKEWIKKHRNERIGTLAATLRKKFQGYWNYYGLQGNSRMLWKYWWYSQGLVYKWLNRRSQRKSYTGQAFRAMWQAMKIPEPRIVESAYRKPELTWQWA